MTHANAGGRETVAPRPSPRLHRLGARPCAGTSSGRCGFPHLGWAIAGAKRPARSGGLPGSRRTRVGNACSDTSGVVGAECAMPVLPPGFVGHSQAKGARFDDHADWRRYGRPPCEQEDSRTRAVSLDVGLELRGDLRAELEPPVLLLSLGYCLTRNRRPAGWNCWLSSMTLRLTVTVRLTRSRSLIRSSASSPQRSPVSMAVSTRSRASASGSAA